MSDLQSSWPPNRIHLLRLRLGWSYSDLARRLDCTSVEILKWEHQELYPETKYLSMLERIEKQADEASHEIQICPLAESRLESTSQEQILLDDLM